MEHKSAKRATARTSSKPGTVRGAKSRKGVRASGKRTGTPLIMSEIEFAKLGGGEVAYIKSMTTDEAMRLYPTIKGLPRNIHVFALHAADGTPIALTDSRQAAIGHAIGDKLEVASLH